MKIILKNLRIKNFKGIAAREFNFLSGLNIIDGENGTGKSTVFDAFTWLLFGKDQFGRSDIDIFPIAGGEMLKGADTEVNAVLVFDGHDLVLNKTLHQKWVHRRADKELVYNGTETSCMIDGVPKKIGEYDSFILTVLKEEMFSLLTNPEAFFRLDWKAQRRLLFSLTNYQADDARIAGDNADFLALLSELSGRNLDEYRKSIASQISLIKKQNAEDIIPRLKQTIDLTPKALDWAVLDKEKESVEHNLSVIEGAILDAQKAQDETIKNNNEIILKIGELKTKMQDYKISLQQKSKESAASANQKRMDIMRNISASNSLIAGYRRSIDISKRNIQVNELSIKKTEDEIEATQQKYKEAHDRVFIAASEEGEFTCPYFRIPCTSSEAKQELADEREASHAEFCKQRDKDVKYFTQRGFELVGIKTNYEKALDECKNTITSEEANIAAEQKKVEGWQAELLATPEVSEVVIDFSKDETVTNMQNEIAMLHAQMNEVTTSTELLSERKELSGKLAELNAKLDIKKDIERFDAEAARLDAISKDLQAQIVALEKKEYIAKKFMELRISESENIINSYFKNIHFRLSDTTLDGTLYETCIAENGNHVPYAMTNLADKVNMGLEMIEKLSLFEGITAPVFIDRAESINSLYTLPSQMVVLRVSTSPDMQLNRNLK